MSVQDIGVAMDGLSLLTTSHRSLGDGSGVVTSSSSPQGCSGASEVNEGVGKRLKSVKTPSLVRQTKSERLAKLNERKKPKAS